MGAEVVDQVNTELDELLREVDEHGSYTFEEACAVEHCGKSKGFLLIASGAWHQPLRINHRNVFSKIRIDRHKAQAMREETLAYRQKAKRGAVPRRVEQVAA